MEVGSDDSEEGGSCHVFSSQISSPKVFLNPMFLKNLSKRARCRNLIPVLNLCFVFFVRFRMHSQPGSRIHMPKPNLDRSLAGYVAGIPGKLPHLATFHEALSFKACLNCGTGLSVGRSAFFFWRQMLVQLIVWLRSQWCSQWGGGNDIEGFHSWKLQCSLWLCPTSLFLVVFRSASVVCDVSIKKGSPVGDTKWWYVKSKKCSRMQQIDLEVYV